MHLKEQFRANPFRRLHDVLGGDQIHLKEQFRVNGSQISFE
jgi:hypothetical protein